MIPNGGGDKMAIAGKSTVAAQKEVKVKFKVVNLSVVVKDSE